MNFSGAVQWGLHIDFQGILESPFQVAIQNNDMKIRLGEARTRCEYGAKLEDVYGHVLDIGGESLVAEIVY